MLSAVRRRHRERRGEHLQSMVPTTALYLPQSTIKSASNPNEKRRRVPQQQQVEKGRRPQERRNGGERETRGILSPVSRRPVLSCSSLTSLLRFAVAMEPATQSSNGVAREFCCFAKFGS
jgi:hypothetical protein